jgi:hypothetical protein
VLEPHGKPHGLTYGLHRFQSVLYGIVFRFHIFIYISYIYTYIASYCTYEGGALQAGRAPATTASVPLGMQRIWEGAG